MRRVILGECEIALFVVWWDFEEVEEDFEVVAYDLLVVVFASRVESQFWYKVSYKLWFEREKEREWFTRRENEKASEERIYCCCCSGCCFIKSKPQS
jgi:hypothetical protein